MPKMAKVNVWVPNLEALNKVLSAARAHLECGGPKRDGDQFVVTVYATPAEAKKIAALKYRCEVDESFGETLKQRQKEVSKTDRFQGGKIKAEGLGIKR
jgi:hypothetical protein